jgi:flagellar biosynthesis protein FlhA
VFGVLQGINAKDPAFGLEAVWIEPAQREHAQTLGYTVVDASTVIATHLSQLLKQHAHELLGHEEVQQLLNVLSRSAPKLVEDLVPKTVTLGVMVRVLQGLLEEGIAIRDMRTIAETLAEQSGRNADVAELLTQVRIRLSRMIVQNINGMAPELPVIALDPALEQILQSSVQDGGRGGISLEPGLAERLLRSLADAVKAQEVRAEPAVLLVPPSLRSALAKLARHGIEGLSVLSYNEVPEDKRVRLVATIGR